MEMIPLPDWDVPDLPGKQISSEGYRRWVARNLKRLAGDDRLDKLRQRPERRPVDVRFVLE